MRLVTCLIIMVILFVSFGVYVNQQTLRHLASFRDEIDTIAQHMKAGEWELADAKIADLQKRWNTVQDRWDLFIFHQDIDDVEMILARLTSFVHTQDLSQALAELTALDMKFSHIYRNEMFNLQNVL